MNTAHRSTPQAALLLAAPDQATLLPPGQSAALDAQLVRRFQPSAFSVAPAAGQALVLKVSAGAVWLTWPGCGDDHYVAAGKTLRLPTDAAALAGLLIQAEPRLAPGAAQVSLLLLGQAVQAGARIDSAPSCPTPSLLQPLRQALASALHPAQRATLRR